MMERRRRGPGRATIVAAATVVTAIAFLNGTVEGFTLSLGAGRGSASCHRGGVAAPATTTTAAAAAVAGEGRRGGWATGPARRHSALRKGFASWRMERSSRPGRPLSSTAEGDEDGAETTSALPTPALGADGLAPPHIWVSALSTSGDLSEAIEIVAKKAVKAGLGGEGPKIDLAIVHVSSIYGSQGSLNKVVTELRERLPGLRYVMGSTGSGVVGMRRGKGVEVENQAGLSVTFASLPGVTVKPFTVGTDGFDLPELDDSVDDIRRQVLGRELVSEDPSVLLLYPTATFMGCLVDYMANLDRAFPDSTKFGAISSTVSSLTRPQVFAGIDEDLDGPVSNPVVYGEGLVGVALLGDIAAKTAFSQGAAAVGPLFSVEKFEDQTLQAVSPIAAVGGRQEDKLQPVMPPLAAAKLIQRQLPPNASRKMQSGTLLGIEPLTSGYGSNLEDKKRMAGMKDPDSTSTPSLEDSRRFLVQSISRSNMKTGACTLGSKLGNGQRVRFFVRNRESAEKELNDTLDEYREGREEAEKEGEDAPFQPVGCLIYPSFDRGFTLFERENHEASKFASTTSLPIGGFFSNGAIGQLRRGTPTAVLGSSTGFMVLSPKSREAMVSSTAYALNKGRGGVGEGGEGASEGGGGEGVGVDDDDDDEDRTVSDDDPNFEIRRRDLQAGRTLNTGPVEYSVAEKMRQPSNRLEAWVWQKEKEVDRQRDAKPLAMLVSKVKAFAMDPALAPRDFVGALRQAVDKSANKLALIAEIKCSAPLSGPLFEEDGYKPTALTNTLSPAAAAFFVCTDRSFFGGILDDLTDAKEGTTAPVLSSDMVVYPYQIYQARLAGADAVKLIVPGLPPKDLIYFHKIAKAVGLQAVVTVCSVPQMLLALDLADVEMVSVSCRNLATWTVDKGRVSRILSDPSVQAKLASMDKPPVIIAEGGLSTPADVQEVASVDGVSVVVVGEALMVEEEESRQSLVQKLLGH